MTRSIGASCRAQDRRALVRAATALSASLVGLACASVMTPGDPSPEATMSSDAEVERALPASELDAPRVSVASPTAGFAGGASTLPPLPPREDVRSVGRQLESSRADAGESMDLRAASQSPFPAPTEATQEVLIPEAIAQLKTEGVAGPPTVSVGNAGENFEIRARDFAADQQVRGHLAYLRFDVSRLGTARAERATLTLHKTGGNTLWHDRVAVFGLLNRPGNTPQEWAPSFSPGSEFDMSMFEDDVASLQAMPLRLEQLAALPLEVEPFTVNLRSDAFVAFLQSRIEDGGSITLLVAMPSQGAGNDRRILFASSAHENAALHPTLAIDYVSASVPQAPESLALADLQLGPTPEVTLRWAPVVDALRYRVFRRLGDHQPAVAVGDTTAPQLVDTSAELLETYNYSVAVQTLAGTSMTSPELEVFVGYLSPAFR